MGKMNMTIFLYNATQARQMRLVIIIYFFSIYYMMLQVTNEGGGYRRHCVWSVKIGQMTIYM